MNHIDPYKYKPADQLAEIFCIVFFGVLLFLGAYWLLNLAGEILVNIEGTLF